MENILSKSLKSIKQTETLSGELSFNIGSPTPNSDLLTTSYLDKFYLKRAKNDSVIGWNITDNMEDLLNDMSYQSFYNGQQLTYFMKKDSAIVVNPAKQVKSNFTIDIVLNKLIGNVSFYSDRLFLSDSIFNMRQNSWLIGEITLLSDTIIGDIDCFMIQNEKHGDTPKFNAVYSNTERIAIDKNTYFPVYLHTHFKRAVDGEPQIDQACSFQINKLHINEPLSDELFNFNLTEKVNSKHTINEIKELKKGDYLPSLNLLSVNNDLFSLSSLKGQISILEFGYIGCAPCVLVSTELKKSYLNFKDNKKIRFYYINLVDKIERIKEYSKKENIPFEILIGNDNIANALGLKSYPKVIVVDKDTRINKIINGYSGPEMGADINESIYGLMNNGW
ncbi:MAG: TlpA family protein disulfide reductase [Prolixibacteraceae bacterium]|nr:TlpA family protein disulfide reductase [Prolixibacteraceae bacterium]